MRLVREALLEHRVQGELLVIADGDSAIRFLQELDSSRCPRLIIIDLNLPKVSGRDVLTYIRESRKCNFASRIVLSSSDAQQDRVDALQLGAHRYIRKPLHLAEFLSLGAVFKAIIEAVQKEWP